jgi:hypothetical protein
MIFLIIPIVPENGWFFRSLHKQELKALQLIIKNETPNIYIGLILAVTE